MKNVILLLLCMLVAVVIEARDNPVLSKHIGTANGLSSNNIKCLFIDSKGFLWIGTDNGLDRFDGKNIRSYMHNPGDSASLANNDINAICEDDKGHIWIATAGGLSTMNTPSGHFANYRSIICDDMHVSFRSGVQAIAFYRGKLYFASEGLIITTLPSLSSPAVLTKDNLRYEGGRLICAQNGACVTKKGLWILTGAGMFYSEDGVFFFNRSYNPFQLPVLNTDDVSAFCSDGDTACCYTTMSFPGIYKFHYRPKQTRSFGFKELNDEVFISVCRPLRDEIWAATPYNVYIIDETTGKCTASHLQGTAQNIAGLRIKQLLADDHNTVFEATNQGLWYDNFSASEPVAITTDGKSKPAFVNPHLPGVEILSVKRSGVDFPLLLGTKSIDISYHDKIVSFEFAAPNFVDAEKTQYAYTLEGYDCDWYYNQNRTTASYNSLPEGDYIFRVKAVSPENHWEGPEYTMNIHVGAPFWKTWWVFTLCFIAACVLSYIVYYIRLRQYMRIQSIRNKISKDLHDDIGSALSSIAIYGEVAKKYSEENAPEAVPILNSMQETTKTAMENMNDIVWSINPQNDKFIATIERLEIFAYEILNAKGIKLQFIISEKVKEQKLSMQQRKNIYLICKEAINNIAKYSEARNCVIEILNIDKEITITIKDDGKGIEQSRMNLGGNGIINMKNRTSELKGILDIFSEKNEGTLLSLKFML